MSENVHAIFIIMKHDTNTQTESPVTWAKTRKMAEAIAIAAELESENGVEYYVKTLYGK